MTRPIVVGIAGGTASGKTSIAIHAAKQLGAALIQHDRYYFDAPEPRGHNFDHPDSLQTALFAEHLGALRRGDATDLPVYDFGTHSRSLRSERMEPGAIILAEGILVLADARLRAEMDMMVFVDAPVDVRLARRLRRDIVERGRSVESVLDQYLLTVRPMHERYVEPSRAFASLTLDGEGEFLAQVDRLVSAVRGL